MPERAPRLCFVGPILGGHPGWVTTQGEILADLFGRAGYNVVKTSTRIGRAARLADTLASLWAWRHQYDLIVLSVFSGPAFGMAVVSAIEASLLRKPVIMWLHGGNLPNFTKRFPWLVRSLMKRAAVIVSPSEFLAAEVKRLGFEVQLIPNVVDMGNVNFRQRRAIEPNLLWMRTFHELYHPEMAVEVLAKLRQVYPNARLTMAGQDKGLLAETRALVERLGLVEAVHFPGFLNNGGKQREFDSHDIYLHTNRVDNMPVSVVEAAAFGLPVVATQVGGIPYLLTDGQTGLLVKQGDAGAMCAAVERLLDQPELAEKLSLNGRAMAEKSDWPVVRAQWERLFEKISHEVYAGHPNGKPGAGRQ